LHCPLTLEIRSPSNSKYISLNKVNDDYQVFGYRADFLVTYFSNIDERTRLYAWEEQWLDDTFSSENSVGDVYFNINSVRSNDLRGGVESDNKYIIIGFILAYTYVIGVLGVLGHSVKSRCGLGSCAVLSVGFATACTFGLCSFVSFYGPVHQALPLLMLAVGVDDAFVIVTIFDELDRVSDNRERTAQALSKAGTAITATSLTNSCAYFVASFTRIRALRTFALWAAIGKWSY